MSYFRLVHYCLLFSLILYESCVFFYLIIDSDFIPFIFIQTSTLDDTIKYKVVFFAPNVDRFILRFIPVVVVFPSSTPSHYFAHLRFTTPTDLRKDFDTYARFRTAPTLPILDKFIALSDKHSGKFLSI